MEKLPVERLRVEKAPAEKSPAETSTVVDSIILGCLHDKPMSGYMIKQMISNSTAYFYNASYGSIYPSLKKHEENGWVTSHEEIERGRYKKIYEITPAGRRVFREWMNESPGSLVIKYDMLLRLFFFENLDPGQRMEQIQEHIWQIKAAQKELRAIEPYARNEDVFKQLAWQWGDEFYDFTIQWFERVLAGLLKQAENADTEEGKDEA